jgi:leader peptidase (prepilin peptidase)/N-methyltransferase
VDFRLFPLLFAPFAGSFLGVLIMRLPGGSLLARRRSACEQCGTALAARDLVPILSYLLLRGRCRHCGGRIGAFHLWVELAAVAVAASACLVAVDPAWLWADCLLGWGLLALAWIDANTRLLPDALNLPLLAIGLAATAWLAPEDAGDHALAAAVGVSFFLAVAATYRRLRGRDGLGMGDAKLMGVAGAWVGLAALPWVVFAAAVLGLLAAGVWQLGGGRVGRTTAIPFGPFLALAIWAIRLTG